MDCQIRPAVVEDKPLLRNLLQLYLYDLSQFYEEYSKAHPLDRNGEFRYDYLDNYWAEKGRYAYVFECDGLPAGFALVRNVDGRYFEMAEFFVLRQHRSQGFGRKWATELIRRHPGDWEIQFYKTNEVAAGLWRSLAAQLAAGGVREVTAADPSSFRLRFRISGEEVEHAST